MFYSGSGLTVRDGRGSAPVSGRRRIIHPKGFKEILDFCFGTVGVSCVGYGGFVLERSNFFGGYLVLIACVSLASTPALR